METTYVEFRVVRLRAEFDIATGQTRIDAIDDARQELLRTTPRIWEHYRWHLKHNMGIGEDILQHADRQLTIKPYKASLGEVQTNDEMLRQIGFAKN